MESRTHSQALYSEVIPVAATKQFTPASERLTGTITNEYLTQINPVAVSAIDPTHS